jgi:homoprotocatechuate degradation regulator HpaR
MAIQQFSASLPIMLYRALDAIMPRFRRIFSDFGLTEQQWRVLRVLWESDEVSIRDLSALTLIPAPSLVGIVDRLQKAGLVKRRRSDEDRRIVFVLATAKGADLETQIMPRVQASYLELKQSMHPDVWNDMLSGLHTLTSYESVVEEARDPAIRSKENPATETPTDAPFVTQANDL